MAQWHALLVILHVHTCSLFKELVSTACLYKSSSFWVFWSTPLTTYNSRIQRCTYKYLVYMYILYLSIRVYLISIITAVYDEPSCLFSVLFPSRLSLVPGQAVLFEYDVLASSSSNGSHASPTPKAASNNQPVETTTSTPGFQPLSPSGENLVDEITGLLGKARGDAGLEGDSLQDMGRTLIADLKKKMGSGGAGEALPKKSAAKQQLTRHPQDSDPAAKYMDKVTHY